MVDIKISGLTDKGAAMATTDEVEINESGVSKSASGANIVSMVGNDNLASIGTAATAATNLGLGTGDSPTFAGLTLSSDGTSATDAATKGQLDTDIAAVQAGLFWKEPCLVATTANITLSGEQTLDGVLTSASRVLVKNQTAPAQNGIYVSAASSWTRATPMDAWDEFVSAAVNVGSGTVHGDTSWNCTVDAGGTLNTTAITFVQWGGLVSAGAGLSEASGVVSLDLTSDNTFTGDQTLGPITETQTVKAVSFTPSLTAEGTIYNCNAAITITMPTATAGKGFTIIHDDGTEITWAGTILWAAGAAPTAAAAKEIYVFLSDGTNWYGNLVGTGYA